MRDALYYGQPVNWAHPLNSGLTAWWVALPWWQSGMTFVDITRRYPGTITGATWSRRNRVGGYGALLFDGTDDYVNCGTIASANAFTASCWIRPTLVDGSWHHFFCHQDDGNPNRTFALTISGGYIAPSNRISVFVKDSGADAAAYSLASAVQDAWQHVVATLTGANGDLTIYINGVAEHTISNIDATTGSHDLFLGNMSSSGSPVNFEYFAGEIDDVCYWVGRSLTASEVDWLYRLSRRGNLGRLSRLPSRRTAADVAAPAFDPVNFPWTPSPTPVERPSRVIAF